MMEEQNRDELIDKYLLGELDEASLLEFQKKLSEDVSFSKEVEAQQVLFNSIRLAGRTHWKDQLELIHADLKRPGHAPRKLFYTNKRIWMAAASLLTLSGILMVVMYVSNADNRLFRSFFNPYPVLGGSTRSADTTNKTPLQQAISMYAAGNYAESIRLFKPIPDLDKEEMALFYLGNAYLGNGQPDMAQTIFREYLSNFSRLATESKWYLCLSYLKQGKKNEARIGLSELSLESNKYGQQAADLLKQL